MNNFLKILGIIFLALIGFSIFVFIFFIRPIIKEEASLKPVMLEVTKQFLECAYDDKQIGSCYKNKTNIAFQKAISLDQFTSLISKIKNRLGNRMSSEIFDEKFNLTVMYGTETPKRINFTLRSAYQNDIFVTETYQFSTDKKTNEFKLDSLFFNSDKLID